jgi:hypothetical protein
VQLHGEFRSELPFDPEKRIPKFGRIGGIYLTVLGNSFGIVEKIRAFAIAEN